MHFFWLHFLSVSETNVNVHWTSWVSKHWPCSNIFHVHDFRPRFFPRWPLSPVAVVLLWPWLLVANSLCLNQVERWLEGSKITKSYNRQMLKKSSHHTPLSWNGTISLVHFHSESWFSPRLGAVPPKEPWVLAPAVLPGVFRCLCPKNKWIFGMVKDGNGWMWLVEKRNLSLFWWYDVIYEEYLGWYDGYKWYECQSRLALNTSCNLSRIDAACFRTSHFMWISVMVLNHSPKSSRFSNSNLHAGQHQFKEHWHDVASQHGGFDANSSGFSEALGIYVTSQWTQIIHSIKDITFGTLTSSSCKHLSLYHSSYGKLQLMTSA